MHASLAVRVEPALLRRLRLNLLPSSNASAEADLWTSPLVRTRSREAIVLSSRVTSHLREQLAADEPLLERTYREVEAVHEECSPLLRAEEELIYLGLRPPGAENDERMRHLLRQLVASMRESGRVRGLSSWLMTSFPSLPARVRETDEARALALVASTQVPRLRSVSQALPSSACVRLIKDLLPEQQARLIALRRTQRHLEVRTSSNAAADRRDGWHVLEVVATTDRLEILGLGSVAVSERTARVAVDDAHEVRLRTPDGALYTLRPRLDEAATLLRATVDVHLPGAKVSGCLVAPDVVVTASAPLRGRAAHEIQVIFGHPPERRPARRIIGGEDQPVAALLLSAAAHGRLPIPLPDASEWRRELSPELVVLGNVVVQSSRAFPLASPRMGARIEFSSKGVPEGGDRWLGAPVVAGGRLLGIVVGHGESSLPSGPSDYVERTMPEDVAAVLDRVRREPDDRIWIFVENSRGPSDVREALVGLIANSREGVELAFDVTRAFIGRGRFEEAMAALELAETLVHPGNVQSTQLRALILSRQGNHSEAISLLSQLVDDGYRDAESLSLLAASHKRRWQKSGEQADLVQACDYYADAYAATNDPYPGINAAALALYRGDRPRSLALARDVLGRLKGRDAGDHWRRATLGEALQLSGDLAGARQAYREAVSAAGEIGLWQDVAVMRQQARRNLEALGMPSNALDDVLSLPGIVGFSGQPPSVRGSADDERLPSTSELRSWLRRTLDACNALEGFSSAARGADLVFIEVMLARGGHVSVFIPEDDQAFRATWVGPGWHGTFDELLAHPRVSVIRVPNPPQPLDIWSSVLACQRAAAAACKQRAALLDQGANAFVIWRDAAFAARIQQAWADAGVTVDALATPAAPR
jgi:tetratricopeptide (TPR) repeat protein